MPLFTPEAFPTEMATAYCPDCAADQLVEQPPCLDGHDDACPERVCVVCGTALLIGIPEALVSAPDALTDIRGAA